MRTRVVTAALCVGALAVAGIVLAVVAPWSGPRSQPASYPLPPIRPVGISLATPTTTVGPFEAGLFGSTACAWVGAVARPPTTFTWPAGWRIRLHPAELVDPSGRVLARQGVQAAIVGDMVGPGTGPCATAEQFGASVDYIGYDLWSDGWKPGQPAMLVAAEGTFHATVTAQGACAWLGDATTVAPFQWPANWTVQFTPKPQLVDSNGKILAVEGQRIRLPGGNVQSDVAGTGTRCGSTKHGDVFAVNGSPGG